MYRTPRSEQPLSLSWILLIYLLCMVALITLLPFRFQWFRHPKIIWYAGITDVTLNICLFLPLGFLYQFTHRDKQDTLCWKVLGLGMVCSLCIEFVQLFLPGRYTSLLDILTNGIGAWLGALLHNRAKRYINEHLVNQLVLELPLMHVVYLLVPLLWLHGLAAGNTPAQVWLSPLLGLLGGTILASVWKHRLSQVASLSPNRLVCIVAAWYLLASLPGLLKQPLFFALCTLGIMGMVRLQLSVPDNLIGPQPGKDARFELITLRRIAPFYGVYLILLAVLPLPSSLANWQGNLGFSGLGDDPEFVTVLRLLEYIASYTLLGYMLGEWRGRHGEPFPVAMYWVSLICFASGGLSELLRGYHPAYTASLGHLAASVSGGVCGGLLYHAQLRSIRQLLGHASESDAGHRAQSSREPQVTVTGR